jgi:hypothetical protein
MWTTQSSNCCARASARARPIQAQTGIGDLPSPVAQRIAWGNAAEMFGLAEPK